MAACKFCFPLEDLIVKEHRHFIIALDENPPSGGVGYVLMAKRHVPSIEKLSPEEEKEYYSALSELYGYLRERFPKRKGMTILTEEGHGIFIEKETGHLRTHFWVWTEE